MDFAAKIEKFGIILRILLKFSELNSENYIIFVCKSAESQFFGTFRWFTIIIYLIPNSSGSSGVAESF
jgi:hypothetical protein